MVTQKEKKADASRAASAKAEVKRAPARAARRAREALVEIG